MRKIQIDGTPYNCYSDWPEITPGLLLRLTPLLFAGERPAAQAALVPLICDAPPETLAALAPWQFAQLFPLTDWLWDTPLTIPIIPHFQHAGLTWHLPAAQLLDPHFAYIEWDHLDTFLARFFAGETEAIDHLCATIARPSDGQSDARARFDAQLLDRHAALLVTLGNAHKAYLLHFALGCSRHIREQFAILWEKDDDAPDDPAAAYTFASSADDLDFGWTGAAFSIAEAQAFGTFNQVIHTDAYTILYYLSWKKQQDRAARRAMQKMQKK